MNVALEYGADIMVVINGRKFVLNLRIQSSDRIIILMLFDEKNIFQRFVHFYTEIDIYAPVTCTFSDQKKRFENRFSLFQLQDFIK